MLDNTKTYPANVDFIPRILDDVRILTIANNGPKLHSIFITLFLSLSFLLQSYFTMVCVLQVIHVK